MTITLTPETETLLREKAQRDGAEMNALAEAILSANLRAEAEEQRATLESLRRGLDDSDAGRVRPLAAFAAEMRTKYNLPTHLSDEELQATP